MPASQRLWSTSNRATFTRFTGVAVAIAVIDIGLLYLLKLPLGINVYLARIASYSAAMTAGYFLNRRYTFHHHQRQRHLAKEMGRFYTVFAGGGLLNYLTFAAIVALGHHLSGTATVRLWLPLVGVWVGGLAGMGFNYGLSRKLVFHSR